MDYKPRPIDTSGVKLSERLVELQEKLAENTHDQWALQRMAEGWVYGPERDDLKKEHPCLVPYDQLPDSEKVYDRQTALEAIKAIMAMGYHLADPDEAMEPVHTAAPGRHDPAAVLQMFKAPGGLDLNTTIELWNARNPETWSRTPKVYQALAHRILRLGEPLLAYDVAAEGVDTWPSDVRLRQLMGLALFRCRAVERAMGVFQTLYEEGHRDEETLGLLGRAHKDLAERASDPSERDGHLQAAYDAYRQGFDLTGGYWTGINAATMAGILGRRDTAFYLAEKVRGLCLAELEEQKIRGGDLYWVTATLAETALVSGDWEEAVSRYAEAARMAGPNYGDLSSTRRNARLLIEAISPEPKIRKRLEDCFHIPRVVCFSGHMIDRAGRSTPRFPASLEDAVREELRKKLTAVDGRIGFSSAACGSDILFLETILELGGEAHVILPYEPEQFIRDSVAIIPGSDWVHRFRRILERATEVLIVSEQPMDGSSASLEYANLLLLGLAVIRAEQLQTSLKPLAVWGGGPGDGPGGTAGSVEKWNEMGLGVEIVNPLALSGHTDQSAPKEPERALAPGVSKEIKAPDFQMELKAMLFADAVGFSKLNERQIPLFVTHFLGGVSALLAHGPHRPLSRATWGDGLYFVFENAGAAGRFALDLCDFVIRAPWEQKGFPQGLNLRIALHAGPVYHCLDPITGLKSYTGMHVTRAARIEPVTPPGQVYTSREFAALAATENVKGLACEYVGLTPLAKKYGTIPMYHLRRMA